MRVRKSVQEYYRALGLAPGASQKEVRRAYLRMVKLWHPDQFAQNPRSQTIAQDKLKEINEAYSFLREISPASLSPIMVTATLGPAATHEAPPKSGMHTAAAPIMSRPLLILTKGIISTGL